MWPFTKRKPPRPDAIDVASLVQLIEEDGVDVRFDGLWYQIRGLPNGIPLEVTSERHAEYTYVVQLAPQGRNFYVTRASLHQLQDSCRRHSQRRRQEATAKNPTAAQTSDAIVDALITMRRRQLAELEARRV